MPRTPRTSKTTKAKPPAARPRQAKRPPEPTEPRYERDDPRSEVADFSRPADRIPEAAFYRPHRVDMERQEFWSERAAIYEYLGGHERWISERMAYEDLRYAYGAKVIR